MTDQQTNLLIRSFEAFPNFVIVDTDSRIAFINQSYCRLLGTSAEKALGRPVTDVIPNTLMPEIIATGRTDTNAMMTVFDHETGEDINVLCTRMPLWENDQIIGAVAVTTFSDISQLEELSREIRTLRQENNSYKKEIARLTMEASPLTTIIGQSSGILAAKKSIQDFAPSDLPILITGETGVGKEVFANAIHEMSRRKDQPFIKINCAAIPAELLESELFGYEAGAFTGARAKGKIGLFEAADHGTLLLDEIGEMPMPLQSKLLRALQEQEIQRIGGTRTIPVDIRLICSTNRNVQDMIREKRFREDLYYRINTVEIEIPPLRERPEDLELLCNYFIDEINQKSGIHTLGMEPGVLERFRAYRWPGNIRELKHVMDRLTYVNPNGWISVSDCDFFLNRSDTPAQTAIPAASLFTHPYDFSTHDRHQLTATIRESRENAEISAITAALTESGGNKAKAARILGIDRSVLYYKMKKYDIR